MIIEHTRTNIMGTLSITLKAKPMRKSQEFNVYPMSQSNNTIWLQSDTRVACIDLTNGRGLLSVAVANYPTFNLIHSGQIAGRFELEITELEELKKSLRTTGGENVGSSLVFCDNSGAIAIG